MTDSVFADNFKPSPYWWEGHEEAREELRIPPAKADIVIVGSGYTGLSAGLTLARTGRDVVILEAEHPGFGCSTRNGGHIGPGIHHSLHELAKIHGKDAAYAIKREGNESYEFLLQLIAEEGISCGLSRPGHFIGAHTPKAFERLRAHIEREPRELGEAQLVERQDVRKEVGTDAFFGGVIYPGRGGLHPKLYHKGLMARAIEAGVRIFPYRPALGISGKPGSLTVAIPGGQITARNVILATNGYTGKATPWWRSRIVAIGSYIIATEELPAGMVARLCPKGYQMNETRKVVYYYRPSPDGKRILFGGRVALLETDARISAPRLHAAMVRVFPELKETKVTHSWMGFPAFTFDGVPHFGVHDGVHYAMGCCPSGVPISTYLGNKVANMVLGRPAAKSVFESLRFQTRPLYTGKPWFLAPTIMYYKFKDRFLS